MPTTFAKKLATIANGQYDDFRFNSEDDPPLANQIKKYWTALGLSFPGTSTPWSAVFVSWCVKQAGATAQEFKFNPAHSQFVFEAIRNQTAQQGVFRGRRVNEYAPQVGDIIQNNRGGTSHDYDFAASHKSYASHSAVVVEVGTDSQGSFAVTVGGNESDSVRKKEIRLTNNGLIKQRSSNPFICIIQDLK